MAEADDKIPTLTNIVQPGDEDMFHHFDAHQFNLTPDQGTEPQISLQNNADIAPSTFTPDNLSQDKARDIPSISLEENDLPGPINEDFSDVMLTLEKNLNTDEIRVKIDQAISDSLPHIEAYLKNSLYKKFDLEPLNIEQNSDDKEESPV